MVYFEKWKVIAILAVVVLGFVFAAPNLLSRHTAEGLPGFVPRKQVNLGLDLQGGAHLLLEVQVDTLIRERLTSLVDGVRGRLRKARIGYTGLGVKGFSVGVTLRDPAQTERARRLVRDVEEGLDVTTEGARIMLTLSEQAIRSRRTAALQQSIEIIRRRIDETGTKEPTIQRQGDDRILLQAPGVDDPEHLKSLLGKTAKMTFHLLCSDGFAVTGSRVPPGCSRLPSAESNRRGGQGPAEYLVRKKVQVSGERLLDSQPIIDQYGRPGVSFRFDTVGAKRFGNTTRKNVNKPFAIVLDGEVISAPVIQEPILGGSGQITGSFSVAETSDLALLLRAGALPAPLTILEERTVGPGLGADSIASGKIASIIGLVLVAVFMAVIYGFFGLLAVVALFVNMVLMLAVLSGLQATLTLPGIAGIVLTVGMAVDANVLVFERIREEVRTGRTPISSIEAGYSRAITTIIDSNLTTLIAAVILLYFGTGPVRGFAVTLAIGIVTSMFTAIMLTRLIIVAWLRRKRPTELPI
jgi:preprotein translocase subunit SecD